MPFNFEIEGDWSDPRTQAYDKPKPKEVKLDESEGPKRSGNFDPDPYPAEPVPDGELRIRQLEASMQELFRKIHALEARLGVARDE